MTLKIAAIMDDKGDMQVLHEYTKEMSPMEVIGFCEFLREFNKHKSATLFTAELGKNEKGIVHKQDAVLREKSFLISQVCDKIKQVEFGRIKLAIGIKRDG